MEGISDPEFSRMVIIVGLEVGKMRKKHMEISQCCECGGGGSVSVHLTRLL